MKQDYFFEVTKIIASSNHYHGNNTKYPKIKKCLLINKFQ